MAETPVKMKIRSVRYESEVSLFSKLADEFESDTDIELGEGALKGGREEVIEINTEALLIYEPGKIGFYYDESELSGMEGSSTEIYFAISNPNILYMNRYGAVGGLLVFEKGKRHRCVYSTPIMPFDIGIKTIALENTVLRNGKIFIDYIMEIRGGEADRTKLEITVSEVKEGHFLNEAFG